MSHGKHDGRYPQEKACRTLFVRNVNYGATEEEIRDCFEKYGKIKEVFSRISTRGMVFVTYSDLRDAETAMKNLQRTNIRGRPIDIHYSLPREEDDKFADADKFLKDSLFITLCDTDNEFTVDDARQLFAPFGDIKDIREWSKKDQKIVEFYDTDECDIAKEKMEGKSFKGGILTIKYALAPKNVQSRRPPGPQRRSRSRDRHNNNNNRNYDTPYNRPRNERSHMDYRPAYSGVNHMIKDLASALQQQTQQRFTQQPGSGYPVNNDYSSQYIPPEYNIPPPNDYQQNRYINTGQYYNLNNTYGRPPSPITSSTSLPNPYGYYPNTDPSYTMRNYNSPSSYHNDNIGIPDTLSDLQQQINQSYDSQQQRYSQIPQQYYDRSSIPQRQTTTGGFIYPQTNQQDDIQQYNHRYNTIPDEKQQIQHNSYDYNQTDLRKREEQSIPR